MSNRTVELSAYTVNPVTGVRTDIGTIVAPLGDNRVGYGNTVIDCD